MSSRVSCAGCGWTVPPVEPRPFRCPRAGSDDVDHVLRVQCDGDPSAFSDPEPNPFIRYRRLTHAWHTARALGMSDDAFVSIVRELPAFAETPFSERDGLWIKDETNNVAGSHKARHLMGVMIWLRVAERLDPSVAHARLAIASCGNAALAAATIAREARRELDVFVPEEASRDVVSALREWGANVTRCPRVEGVAGDPAYLRFREAVASGALPFTCQGNENGLVIEGGKTLGWEMASQKIDVDDLFIQVGGGALASACIAALEEARAMGVIARLPRVHAVQTLASPLFRAWERVLERGLEHAIRHRSEFMWPWETPPRSIATGILDDETYDWVAVLRGVLATGGSVITVTEDELLEASRMAGEGVSATGAAGLAGAIAAGRLQNAAVIFTGRPEGRSVALPEGGGETLPG